MTSIARPFTVIASLVCLNAGCGSTHASAPVTTMGESDPYLWQVPTTGAVRVRPEVCHAVPENVPEEKSLDESSLVTFLEHQGFQTSVVHERPDLSYVDVKSQGDEPIRLRVAILPDRFAAGQDLHRALLEHGTGAWGVHRGNLAVLAPVGPVRRAIDFAGRSKLVCWGVFTLAAHDDAYVVPGGYMEF